MEVTESDHEKIVKDKGRNFTRPLKARGADASTMATLLHYICLTCI